MIKHHEELTINIEDIIIASLYSLNKHNKPLEITDVELQKIIEDIQKVADSFADEVTYNLTSTDKDRYIATSDYIVYEHDTFKLKETISKDYADYLAHKLDKDKLLLIIYCVNESLYSSYKEYISYKEQVLIALYALNKLYSIRRITSDELRVYRIKLAEYYANCNQLVTLESNKEAVEQFRDTYKDEISSKIINDTLVYELKEGLTNSKLETLAFNNASSHSIIEVLSSPKILEETFVSTKKLKLK